MAGGADALEAGFISALVNGSALGDSILGAGCISAENDFCTSVDMAVCISAENDFCTSVDMAVCK